MLIIVIYATNSTKIHAMGSNKVQTITSVEQLACQIAKPS